MKQHQKTILRPYFHGLTDEQFEEDINKYPLNNIQEAMNDYALCIVNRALEEERESIPNSHPQDLKIQKHNTLNRVLSRTERLIERK